jgi:hypothetical protein
MAINDNNNSTEYFALVGSFLLVGLEAIIRVLTLALRELPYLPNRSSAKPASSLVLVVAILSSIPPGFQQVDIARAKESTAQEEM